MDLKKKKGSIIICRNSYYSPCLVKEVKSEPEQRTEEGGSSTTEKDADVKLSEGLRALFGNRKYVKESEISRDHLMRYLCGKGEITEVSLLHVDIEVSLIMFIQMPMDHTRYIAFWCQC